MKKKEKMRPTQFPNFHVCAIGVPHKWEHEHTFKCDYKIIYDCPTCVEFRKNDLRKKRTATA